jgi:hypothetical protein
MALAQLIPFLVGEDVEVEVIERRDVFPDALLVARARLTLRA